MNLLFCIVVLLIPIVSYAVCPFCTFAVGAGIGLAQWLGIDDTITGIWIGGLIISLIVWTIDFLNNKNIHFYGRKILVVFIYYGSTILPLYHKGLIGHELNKLWGIDKILLGILIGSIVFIISIITHNILKRSNNDKAYFPFQKVVVPIVLLTIPSIVFYFLTK